MPKVRVKYSCNQKYKENYYVQGEEFFAASDDIPWLLDMDSIEIIEDEIEEIVIETKSKKEEVELEEEFIEEKDDYAFTNVDDEDTKFIDIEGDSEIRPEPVAKKKKKKKKTGNGDIVVKKKKR